MLNVLYIGPNDSEWAQMNRPVNLAAAKWARGFLTGLNRCCRLTALCHTYEVPWPKGRVLWRGDDPRLHPTAWVHETISYPVLKGARALWFRYAYSRAARRIVREKKIDVVLLYNCYEPWQRAVMRDLKTAFGDRVKVVPVLLDGDDPRKDDWGWLRDAARFADAFVPLSWWVHTHLPERTGRPSYHFDGGADDWCGTPPAPVRTEKTLVHTGSLDQWRGLDFMHAVVRIYNRPNVKFVLCGKEMEGAPREAFRADPRVELAGFLDERALRTLCNAADALLNVRSPTHPDNILNYPSKLPHYLSFGRPVVSTRLASLAPDYAEVVQFPADDTPEAYCRVLDAVLAQGEAARQAAYGRMRTWFEAHKRWDVQTAALANWLEELVK